ncbi:hypothetical protein, partial [Escherichia coli]|uniref:hypothetical protein n=1 Tax=Escherichia coli TaxID=562 RepID=UPI003CE58A9F
PLKDDAGAVIGAIGIVLFDQPETTLQPLISKFAVLQRDLDGPGASWPPSATAACACPCRASAAPNTALPALSAAARRPWRS